MGDAPDHEGSDGKGDMDGGGEHDELPRIDGFRVLRKIAEGGVGRVYLAEPEDGSRALVALKLLHRTTAIDEANVRRFLREGRLGDRLSHPHIVPTLGFLERDGMGVLVLEYVPGVRITHWPPPAEPDTKESLDEMLLRLARIASDTESTDSDFFQIREKLLMLARVADALEYAHGCGVIHRDVKPSNILVREDGHPFLIDFGLARNVEVDSTITSTHRVFGTPAYMPPEQLDGPMSQVGVPADVYSLGVTVFQVVSGRLPFEGKTPSELYLQIQTKEPPSLSEVAPDAPPGLDLVVRRALEKDPAHRYPSAAALRDDLERVARGKPPRAGNALLWLRRELRRLQRLRSMPLLAAAAVLAIVLVFVARELFTTQGDLSVTGSVVAIQDGWSALDRGDLEGAIAAFASASDLAPRSVEPHLALAAAHAEYEASRAARRAVDAAVALGYDPSGDGQPQARDLFAQALLCSPDRDLDRPADLLAAAVAQDPDFFPAYLPLYFALARLGRVAEAREALLSYGRNLKPLNPRHALVQALLARTDEDLDAALSTLEALAAKSADRSPDWLHRHLGIARLDVQQSLPTSEREAAEIEAADASFVEALRLAPEDVTSWANRATCALMLDRRDDARRFALTALESSPFLESAHNDLAILIALEATSPADYLEAEGHLDAASSWGRDRPRLQRFQADLAFRRGRIHQRDGDDAAANAAFEQALQRNREHAAAGVYLGANLWARGRYEPALLHLDLALATLETWSPEPGRPPEPWEKIFEQPDLRLDAHVARFGAASQLGRVAQALESLDVLRETLATRDALSPITVLNLAEALARAPDPAARDCAWALRLLDDHHLDERFADEPAATDILVEIRRLCVSASED